jgi:hypothetical protein
MADVDVVVAVEFKRGESAFNSFSLNFGVGGVGGPNFSKKKKSAQKFLEIFRDTNINPHKNNIYPIKQVPKDSSKTF